MNRNYSLNEGVKHAKLGLGIVINNEPDPASNITVKFRDGNALGVHPTELEPWPIDLNGRFIEIGQLILFPVHNGFPAYICQGVVETIKKGKSPGGYCRDIIRIGIREDKSGYIKSVPTPKQCIVIDTPVIKQENL